MQINPNVSELQNVLDHVNEINEWDIIDKHIRRIVSYEMFPLPEFYVESQAHLYDWNSRNTFLELTPAALEFRWSREAKAYYRRIHIDLQLSIYLKDREKRGETGPVMVWFDVDKNPYPTQKEFEKALGSLGIWRFESIELTVTDVVDKGYLFPIYGKMNGKTNGSLIYIGRFILPVEMMPIPPIPDVLDGFTPSPQGYLSIFDANAYGFVPTPSSHVSPFPIGFDGFNRFN